MMIKANVIQNIIRSNIPGEKDCRNNSSDTPVTPIVITDALIMEDGSLFLMEDGSYFRLEGPETVELSGNK